MSIVIMSRKVKAKQNLCNKNDGFSLKGTRRNLKSIGSDCKNSSVRTIFRGSEPVGHGANRSSGYPVDILQSNYGDCIGSTCVPTSTLTNKGYIESHLVNNTNCGEKCIENWVKSFNPEDHSQSSYIRRIKVDRSGCEQDDTTDAIDTKSTCVEDCNYTYYIGTRKISRSTYYQDTNKGAITSGEYTEVELLRNNCLPDASCKKAFPFVLTDNGCRREYYTPQEAIDAGLLPEDWMACKTKYPTDSYWRSNPYN